MKNGPLKYYLKKIFYYPVMRIKRFIDYTPLIWNDEDYDRNFILYMLKYKIERTRKHIDQHKMFDSCKEKVSQMIESEKIIERLTHGLYLEDEFDVFMKKYPSKPMKLNKDGDWYLESTHNKPEGKEFIKLSKKMASAEKADLKKLGHIIETQLMGWWD